MANSDKDILITPNIGSSTDDPKIEFKGANSSLGPQTITAKVYPTNSGTLSFEGSAGQLFSITNNLTSGSIFSVNDVSGVPSIDVDANGTIEFAPFGGTVLINTTANTGTASQPLQVTGGAYVSGNLGIGNTNPSEKLDVVGNIVLGTSGAEGAQISFRDKSGTQANALYIDIDGNNDSRIFQMGNSNLSIGNLTGGAGDIRLFTNASERLRVLSGGNVGIGLTTPGQKLDVSGSIRASSQLISTVATGTAPLTVSSTTLVTNLNADFVDGIDSSRIVFGDNSNKTTYVSNINTALSSGFYDIASGTGSPTAGTWHHVINCRHNNEGNHFAMQIAGNFFSASVGDLFHRVIDNGTPTSWYRMWTAANISPVRIDDPVTNWNNYHHPGGEYYTAVHGVANNHDNFIHEGFYHVDPNGGSNNPTATYAYLRVHRHKNTNYGIQIHYPSGDASYFVMRQAFDSAGTRSWTSWFAYGSLSRNNEWSGTNLFTGNIGNSPTGTAGVWVGKSAGGDGQIQLVGNSCHIDFANGTEDFDIRIIRTSDDILSITGGDLYLESNLRLTGISPTISLIDTDHATASIHVNSNIFYVLRNAANTAGWAQVDGAWPFELNLLNNDASFGRSVYSYSYQNVYHFAAPWRNDGVTALNASYNFLLAGANDTGQKAVHFINSSTRTTDGGANTYTIRNDGGSLRLGNSSYDTILEGSTISLSTRLFLNSSAAERQIEFNNGTTGIYFYGQTVAGGGNVGMFDGTNNRNIWFYSPTNNNLTIARNTTFTAAFSAPQNNNTTGGGIDFNGAGGTFIRGRNQDGANNTLSNLQLQSWFGICFGPSITGQAVPQGENAYWINVRDGSWSSRGSGNIGGVLDVSSEITLGGELNFSGIPTNKYVDFYTKNSGGTNFAAHLRLVNHDSTSFHNAIIMYRDSVVQLFFNNQFRFETVGDGIRLWQNSGYWTGFGHQNGYVSASLEGGSYIDYRNELGITKGHIHHIYFTNGASEIRFGTTDIGVARNTDNRPTRMTIEGTGRVRFEKSIVVSNDNTTGGGIILADDGDIVDLNDGYASMRFSSGVRVYSGNSSGSTAIQLGNDGRILANHTSFATTMANNQSIIQAHGNNSLNDPSIDIYCWSTTASRNAKLSFYRSKNDTKGTITAVASGDPIGELGFYAPRSDNVFASSASILVTCEATPTTAGAPARMTFNIQNGNTLVERFRLTSDGLIVKNQSATASVNSTATITAANIESGIITSSTAAAVTMTLPTGTDMDLSMASLYTNMSFEWSIINTGSTNSITVSGNTAHTIIPATITIAALQSSRFLSRRSGSNTWVTYRIA